jgi:hypothetical protein
MAHILHVGMLWFVASNQWGLQGLLHANSLKTTQPNCLITSLCMGSITAAADISSTHFAVAASLGQHSAHCAL